MPKNYLKLASSVLDRGFIRRHTLKLHELEKSTSNSDFRQSTDYVCEFLREAGFEKIERYALPCDGVTTYDDCTMPLAWDRTGRSTLEILDKSLPKKQRLLADTDIEPINAVIWSVPTPPGGVTAELVDLHNAENGDWDGFRGKIVLCDRSPNGTMLRNLVKSGAIGTVSYIADILDTNPDDVRWMNGVGYCSWYYQKGDKTIWNFSITPRKGAWLADKLRGGEKITLKAVMNTRVYAGETYTVTAVIPGRSGKELALFAHMYEPFLADDSAGVVISAAIGKAIRELVAQRKLPALEHGIRVVFSMERYGFSEFFHQPKRVKRIIAGMNMDSVCHPTLKVAGIPLELRQSPSTAPFFGEIIIRDLLRKNFPNVKFRETPGNLSDDTFAAEPPFDIPTGWLHTPPAPNRHHNTGEVFGGIDWDIAETVFQVITAYYAQIATVRPDKAEFRDLFKRISQAVAKDATDDLNRLQEEYDNGTLNIYAVN
ncbi:MAG: hypothetical protein J6866_06320, partial [Victivallales bacterium]|nr:hypothetical protein [Victivallales bacterium]